MIFDAGFSGAIVFMGLVTAFMIYVELLTRSFDFLERKRNPVFLKFRSWLEEQ